MNYHLIPENKPIISSYPLVDLGPYLETFPYEMVGKGILVVMILGGGILAAGPSGGTSLAAAMIAIALIYDFENDNPNQT